MKRRKPVKGEILYSLNVNNSARNREQVLTPVIVTRIGRKYFTTMEGDNKSWTSCQFYIDTWNEKSNHTANNKLYESKQKYEDEKECNTLFRNVKSYFYNKYHNNNNLSLDSLRKISNIINEN